MDTPTKLGFKLFDNARLRNALEEKLFRVGIVIRLDPIAGALPTIDHYDVLLMSPDSKVRFKLRLMQDWHGAWDSARLLDGASEEMLDEIDFDRTEKHGRSCYEVWTDRIVTAVRKHSQSE